mmetsp:Transcript_121240/g.388353  ORF Transcript_121240/g.388353 Transcript_121240/m.388353 type:complete len:195 (-) Transcript_121240:89-673(-)
MGGSPRWPAGAGGWPTQGHGEQWQHLFYCGRNLGAGTIPGSDGRCGPSNGPQCASCKRYKAPHQHQPQPTAPTVVLPPGHGASQPLLSLGERVEEVMRRTGVSGQAARAALDSQGGSVDAASAAVSASLADTAAALASLRPGSSQARPAAHAARSTAAQSAGFCGCEGAPQHYILGLCFGAITAFAVGLCAALV